MIKRLFFDIEVSPNIGFFWQPGYKLQIDYTSIIDERAIICICYKWEHLKTVQYLKWDKNKNDKAMLKKFVKILKKAEEIVGHNGDKFDLAWIRTRCLYHRIDMVPEYISIDTLKEARKGFKFNSNRLDYMGQFLGLGKKTTTEYGMWKRITLENHQPTLKRMIDYCKNDVLLLESVYNRLKPYIKPKVSMADDRGKCPECNSMRLHKSSSRKRASGTVAIQFSCQDCGKHFTVPEKAFNKARSTVQFTKLTNAK